MKLQKFNEVIDVAEWQSEELFNPYPVGARDKSLIISPTRVKCKLKKIPYIKYDHRYLYKESINRYPEQFWMEIFCYRFGLFLNIPVPPAHAAYNSKTNTCAALIEWFLIKARPPVELPKISLINPILNKNPFLL